MKTSGAGGFLLAMAMAVGLRAAGLTAVLGAANTSRPPSSLWQREEVKQVNVTVKVYS